MGGNLPLVPFDVFTDFMLPKNQFAVLLIGHVREPKNPAEPVPQLIHKPIDIRTHGFQPVILAYSAPVRIAHDGPIGGYWTRLREDQSETALNKVSSLILNSLMIAAVARAIVTANRLSVELSVRIPYGV